MIWNTLKNHLRKTFSTDAICPICNGRSPYLDEVDFNKSCEERRGLLLAPARVPIAYYLCDTCGFCFAPAIAAWPQSDFKALIYNDDYIIVDPDYQTERPLQNAQALLSIFKEVGPTLDHLDYGGGDGLLSAELNNAGWRSESYDPFVDGGADIDGSKQYDLITAFEVFEHVPDPQALVASLEGMLKPDGIIMFSTLLADGQIKDGEKLRWWYAAPRNGHISLYTKNSLRWLATGFGLKFGSYSEGFHGMWRANDTWAKKFIPSIQ